MFNGAQPDNFRAGSSFMKAGRIDDYLKCGSVSIIPQFTNNRKVKTRYATREDAITLQKMFNKVVREKRFLPALEEIEEIDDRWFDLRNQNLIIVAEVGGEVVGSIQLERSETDASSHVCEMGIIVEPNHRGKGVGSALLKKAIDSAKHLGFEKICLSVFHTNSVAIALYKKFGFREVGRRKRQFKIMNEYLDEILMERFLEKNNA